MVGRIVFIVFTKLFPCVPIQENMGETRPGDNRSNISRSLVDNLSIPRTCLAHVPHMSRRCFAIPRARHVRDMCETNTPYLSVMEGDSTYYPTLLSSMCS